MAPDSRSRVLGRHPFVFEEFKPKINLSHIFPSMKPMFFWSHVLLLVIKYELLLSIMVEIRHSFYKFLCTVYVAYVISVCCVNVFVCVLWCLCCVCHVVYVSVLCVGVRWCVIHMYALHTMFVCWCMWAVCARCVLCMSSVCVLCFSSDISWEHRTWVCKHNCFWSRKRFYCYINRIFGKKIQREIIIIKLDIYQYWLQNEI